MRSSALLVLVLLLAGCAAREHRELASALDRAHVSVLRPAGSAAMLDRQVRAGEQFEDLVEEFRRRAYCAIPEHKQYSICRCGKYYCEGDLERIEVTGSRIDPRDLITNNQEMGVDEGGIVKKLGNRLFVLRRGRLYSIDLGTPQAPTLTLLDQLAVGRAAGNEPVWYDEILAVGDSLILLGFNWVDDVAELFVYDISPRGQIVPKAHYGLRTDDYFSDSNYGARIEGEHLLLSLSLSLKTSDRMRWPTWARRDVAAPAWQPLVEPADIYLPLAVSQEPTVHLVLRCPIDRLGDTDLDCTTTGIVGSDWSEFYASANAAYLAVAEWDSEAQLDPRFDEWDVMTDDELADLREKRYTAFYRIPFDRQQTPTVVRVNGFTGNQFSFKEDDAGVFVTTQLDPPGEGREVRLHHVDWAQFGPDLTQAAGEIARFSVSEEYQTFRFSQHALWVGPQVWLDRGESLTSIAPLLRQPLTGAPLQSITLPHSTQRIEPLGDRLIVSGTAREDRWYLSLLDEGTDRGALSTLEVPVYVNSDDRSHAFNAKRLASGWMFGMPGLPLADIDTVGDDAVSDLLLFRAEHDVLSPAAVLHMGEPDTKAANCAHCDDEDWYGNARVFFVDERIFALSAQHLVEAASDAGAVREVRRLRLVPQP